VEFDAFIFTGKQVRSFRGSARKEDQRDGENDVAAIKAAARPCCPSAVAMMISRMVETVRVTIRRRKGLMRSSFPPNFHRSENFEHSLTSRYRPGSITH
jgi:hypothetical protein